jgi:hypothetical protein
MHSFHQSRGRIAFEVLCTLTVSGSCAAAWLQTGVTAFLPAAMATGLYGLWHLTDMRRPAQAKAAMEAAQAKIPVEVVERAPLMVAEVDIDEPAVVALSPEAAPKPKKRSRKKQPDIEVAATPASLAESVGFPDRAAIEEELGSPAGEDLQVPVEEESHAPIAPLFETKPFAHQQRPAFGRKAG